MRIKKILLPIAVMSLWFCGMKASADAFLYELSFDQQIGTRTFGRLAGGRDGYGDLANGDSPVQQVFMPDIVVGYDRVYFQGSGMIEAGTDFLQLYQWLQLGRDVKNSDSAASTFSRYGSGPVVASSAVPSSNRAGPFGWVPSHNSAQGVPSRSTRRRSGMNAGSPHA